MPRLAALKNPLKIARSSSRRLAKFNQFFVVQRYISGKIFPKIQSVILREVAKRQTDKCLIKHNLNSAIQLLSAVKQ